MTAGRIVFDCRLTLYITSVTLSRGKIVLKAEGQVNAILSGVVPYSIYGRDDSLIAVSKCDFDSLIRKTRVRRGDTLALTHDLNIDSMTEMMV